MTFIVSPTPCAGHFAFAALSVISRQLQVTPSYVLIVLPLDVDLQIDLLFISKLWLASFCFRSQLTCGSMIVRSLIKVVNKPTVMVSRGRFDGMSMISLLPSFKNCAGEVVR